MNSNLWVKPLRIAVSAALLCASAAATLMPDWAVTLKAQNYAGYVDLRLAAMSNSERKPHLQAGVEADVLFTLQNLGESDAHRARTIASLQGNISPAGSSGCLEDPVGFPACTLSTPLPAGGSADYLVRFAVPPLARGTVDLAVAAASDDPESEPGQEVVQLHLPIEAHVDLKATARCNRTYLPMTGTTSCQVTFRNDGKAAAVVPYFSTYPSVAGMSYVRCDAARAELCPVNLGSWNAAVIMPDEWFSVTFDLTALPWIDWESIWLYFQAGATSPSEIEDAPADNYGTLALPVPLFRDDFEGAPAPL